MKRVRVDRNVSSLLIGNHPSAVDKVIGEMMLDVVNNMYKEELFTVKKIGGFFNPLYNAADETSLVVEAYCMKESDRNEAVALLHIIKDVVPSEYMEYVERLRKLLAE